MIARTNLADAEGSKVPGKRQIRPPFLSGSRVGSGPPRYQRLILDNRRMEWAVSNVLAQGRGDSKRSLLAERPTGAAG